MDKYLTGSLKGLNLLWDFVFPKACVGCGRVGSYICKRCLLTKMKPYYAQNCHVCRHESRTGLMHKDCREDSNLDGVVVCYVYNELAEKLLAQIKYQFYFAMIDDVAQLVGAVGRACADLQSGVISFVPAHDYREKWRGFNQAQLLASSVAKICDLSCASLLQRNEFTTSQVGKGRQSRLESLHQAFAINAQLKSQLPAKVILVDDVMTTGNTLEQCARVLKQAGVKEVIGLVFARGWYLPES